MMIRFLIFLPLLVTPNFLYCGKAITAPKAVASEVRTSFDMQFKGITLSIVGLTHALDNSLVRQPLERERETRLARELSAHRRQMEEIQRKYRLLVSQTPEGLKTEFLADSQGIERQLNAMALKISTAR